MIIAINIIPRWLNWKDFFTEFEIRVKISAEVIFFAIVASIVIKSTLLNQLI